MKMPRWLSDLENSAIYPDSGPKQDIPLAEFLFLFHGMRGSFDPEHFDLTIYDRHGILIFDSSTDMSDENNTLSEILRYVQPISKTTVLFVRGFTIRESISPLPDVVVEHGIYSSTRSIDVPGIIIQVDMEFDETSKFGVFEYRR